MFKKCGFTALMLLSQLWISSHAATNALPENCSYGRDTSYNVSGTNVSSAVQSGLSVAANPYDPSSWAQFVYSLGKLSDSFDYLRIEGPNHVLQGQNSRFKGNLFDIYAYVNFNTSESGYVGRDKSNLDANAYRDVKFDRTHGYGLVWVTRAGLCSAKGVWVQKKPSVSPITLMGSGGSFIAEVSYQVDPYSKAAKDPATDASIQFFWSGDDGGAGASPAYKFSANSGTFRTFENPTYGGGYSVSARISDGNFSQLVQLGHVTVSGAPWRPCPTCDIP
ncbi:MAG: hypothetical protein KJ556_13905 [Gammaproteobacteria bacterium]|nr:hypothetical protein [Gammaproteobacteria bacterium]MBU2059496.1 hypothetical protein [Gammaproteobacteria bacterium]MBU2176210.1 hypothetical protein [Gammaproteobacteria bacterium]MBU2248143.1 hypothetical protein [Gammaproteobacteria bacterium]MBU2344576.1 hypothetical protein [Gammaproteobacteria bacterium]